MYNPNIRDHAALIGFTRLVFVSNGEYDLEVYVHPDTDFDGRFTAICALEGDTLRINGWQAYGVEDIEATQAAA